MLSSRFAAFQSPVDYRRSRNAAVADLRAAKIESRKTGSGGRFHFGMAAGIKIVGPSGHVVSFEPSPQVLTLLRRNADGKNIKILPYGIGNADALKSFAAQGASAASSFIEEVTAINRHYLPDQPIEQIPVTMRKLDTVLDSGVSPNPTLVKIDIEGFELEALKGADRLLSSVRPKLLIEIHPGQLGLSGGSEDEIFELLRDRRYSWSVIDRNPNTLYSILAMPNSD